MVRRSVRGLLFGDLPRDPDHSFLAVLTDLPPHDVVEGAVAFPCPLHEPCRPVVEVEAGVRDGEDEPSAGGKDPRDLLDRPRRVADVLESHVGHDTIECRVRNSLKNARVPLEEPRAGWMGSFATAGER
jgi:hypothetical protein